MSNFFKSLMRWLGLERNPRVAVVRLQGVIGASGGLRPGLSLAGVAAQLDAAFTMGRSKAVALQINSPGGSPVQSFLIHNRIRALSEEHGIPVFAFCEDVAASGGYILALAADEIFADDSSIIGSIGVVSAGFGFPALLEKLGIERRVHTAGDNKSMLDPFSPEDPDDVRRLEQIQTEVHEVFINLVKARRSERLKSDGEMFTGAFWAGKRAQDHGLIDGIDDLRTVMRRRFGKKVDLKVISADRGILRPKLAASTSLDGLFGAPGQALAWVESRAFWSRFGL